MNNTSIKTDNLIYAVAAKDNLELALNTLNPRGNPGCDGQKIIQLKQEFPDIVDELSQSLINGSYIPKRVFRMYIPKDKQRTSFRMLSIPVVADRMIQTAIVQVLNPIFEPNFCDNSYGFIRHRGCFPALKHTLELANKGYSFVVNIDLKKFFDSVPQHKLMDILKKTITDSVLLDLIQKYLTPEIKEVGKQIYRDTKGIPQGGPLSPLLSNIFLNEMDHYLKSKDYKFSRYADDFIIMCSCEAEAYVIFKDVSDFLHNMEVDINYEKSSIADLSDIEYLGYSFKYDYRDIYSLTVCDKKFEQLRYTLFNLIQKYYTKENDNVFVNRICSVTRGWVNYYALADIEDRLKEIDKWLIDTINNFYYKKIDIYTKSIWGEDFYTEGKDYTLDIVANRLEEKNENYQYNVYYSMHLDNLFYYGYDTMQNFYHKIRKKWDLE